MNKKSKISVIIVALLMLVSSLTGCVYTTHTPPPGWTDPNESDTSAGTTVLSGTRIKVDVIYLSDKEVSLYVGDTFIIAPSIYPSNATDKTVIWTSTEDSIVSVDGGKITAKALGTAKIIARASNGDTAVCTVTVVKKVVQPYYISLNKNMITLKVGDIDTLIATIVPSNSADKTITWESSDSTVVLVDNGKITAVAAGNAEITAATSNKLVTTCLVNVGGTK